MTKNIFSTNSTFPIAVEPAVMWEKLNCFWVPTIRGARTSVQSKNWVLDNNLQCFSSYILNKYLFNNFQRCIWKLDIVIVQKPWLLMLYSACWAVDMTFVSFVTKLTTCAISGNKHGRHKLNEIFIYSEDITPTPGY